MKANKMMFGLLASGIALAGLTQSCASDEPFANGDGEGNLRMQLVVNSDLTRAEMDERTQQLMENCVVYISKADAGLIHKYEGSAQLPDVVPMKFGSYVAEAWTGDSVPADFEKRFYRGYKKFNIESAGTTSVLLECKIANVVVSVNKDDIPEEMSSDWQLRVYNSTGSLDFNAATEASARGYYMMPKADLAYDESGNVLRDDEGWEVYTNLSYELSGTTVDGREFTKKGYIAGKNFPGRNAVEHAHEYVVNFKYNPEYEHLGGSLIEIEIDDSEIQVNVPVGLYSRPAIKGVGFEIEKQLFAKEGEFKETLVKVAGFNGIEEIQLTYSTEDGVALRLPGNGVNLMKADESIIQDLRSNGITWSDPVSAGEEKPYVSYLTFAADYLNGLPEREEEYRINIHVKDGYGRENDATLRLAVGEGAVVEEDPAVLSSLEGNLLAIRATKATFTGTVKDGVDASLVYRVNGTDAWSEKAIAPATRAGGQFEVTITGLTENTHYDVAVRVDGVIYGMQEFTTETKFAIPNGNMETWGTYGNSIIFAGDTNSGRTFWDSGNEGAKMGGLTLTQSDATIKNSGLYSAKLYTQEALSKLAAGNLFIGQFGSTTMQGTTIGAQLSFGRPYSGGSHPDALSVWVKYDPADVNRAGSHLSRGEKDHGQIYVAFTTKTFDINTAKGVYFNPDDSAVLGYGEITWKGTSCGSANALEKIEIPITWRKAAETVTPTHIVVVCAASKYGDYFEGGKGSVMYVDDFELVY